MLNHFERIRKNRGKQNDNTNNDNNYKTIIIWNITVIIIIIIIIVVIIIIENSESCPQVIELVDGAAHTMLFLCSGLEEKETHRPYDST